MAETLGKFLIDVKEAALGSDVALKALGESTDSGGGFLVPDDTYNGVIEVALEDAIVRPRAIVIPTRKMSLPIPTIVDTAHTSTLYGGITPKWEPEAGDYDEYTPTYGQTFMTLKKLVGYAYISDELLADGGAAAEAATKRIFAKALAFTEDGAFLTGAGGVKPLGLLNAPGRVTVSKVSGQTAATIYPENIYKMFCRLFPSSFNKAVWIGNPNTLPLIFEPTLSISDLLQEVKLFGRPFILSEHCKTVGTEGDFMLADFSNYVVLDGGLSVSYSPYVRYQYGQGVFRFVLRTDGKPLHASAITPENGTDTLSSIVTLETRS